MKALKVKFILFSLTAMLAVSFLTSCEQEIVETPVNQGVDRIEQLESDPNYTTLTALNNQLLNEVSNAMVTKNVTTEDLKNMYINEQTDLLEAFYQGTQVESIMNEIVPIANQLSSEYSDLITVSEVSDENIQEGFNNLESMSLESRCPEEYNSCVFNAGLVFITCITTAPIHSVALCYNIYYATLGFCHNWYCSQEDGH